VELTRGFEIALQYGTGCRSKSRTITVLRHNQRGVQIRPGQSGNPRLAIRQWLSHTIEGLGFSKDSDGWPCLFFKLKAHCVRTLFVTIYSHEDRHGRRIARSDRAIRRRSRGNADVDFEQRSVMAARPRMSPRAVSCLIIIFLEPT